VPAPKPNGEEARLAALREYQVVETEAEQVFDDLAQLAALGVDQAIFSLRNVHDLEPFDLLATLVVPAAEKIQTAGR